MFLEFSYDENIQLFQALIKEIIEPSFFIRSIMGDYGDHCEDPKVYVHKNSWKTNEDVSYTKESFVQGPRVEKL